MDFNGSANAAFAPSVFDSIATSLSALRISISTLTEDRFHCRQISLLKSVHLSSLRELRSLVLVVGESTHLIADALLQAPLSLTSLSLFPRHVGFPPLNLSVITRLSNLEALELQGEDDSRFYGRRWTTPLPSLSSLTRLRSLCWPVAIEERRHLEEFQDMPFLTKLR